MHFKSISTVGLVVAAAVITAARGNVLVARAEINGPCKGKDDAPGVCVDKATCDDPGEAFIHNACPNTPDHIKCCTKPRCGDAGNCRWTKDCKGTPKPGLCPGPADFQCCIPDQPTTKVNGPCKGKGGAPGVCLKISDCDGPGEDFIHNACPGTPDDVKCCSKTSCGTEGNCRWSKDCSTPTVSGLCPGPADFKCCVPSGSSPSPTPTPTGGGGSEGDTDAGTQNKPYDRPSIPETNCKQVSQDGGKAIVDAHPGAVREVGCHRDCACGSDPSDHCCGMAVDIMCSDKTGTRTALGRPIAEWVVRNHARLNVKYVIWGQRIWESDEHEVTPWGDEWGVDPESLPDEKGSPDWNRLNHWDHVHVSFLS